MKLNAQKPRNFINPLLSRKGVDAEKFNAFKLALENYKKSLSNQISTKQTEPNIVASTLKPFLDSFGYQSEPYSQKGQISIDLAVMQNLKPSVIIEAKMRNSADMIVEHDLNKRAFHQAIMYFMNERAKDNKALFHIIVTDFNNWFVFDAKDFDRHFWQNKMVKKVYDTFNNPSLLGGDKTKQFYDAIAKELPKLKKDLLDPEEIACAHFNIQLPTNEKELTAIYKLLSADCLLKEFNPNDANSLNREFYAELLYILGLEESKDGGKKVIGKAKNPQNGTLYENISNKLAQYNKPNDFESVIKLIIIWVNRILFLKLLESQIVKWTGNKDYKFLNPNTLDQYDALETLFFEVLAKPIDKRNIHHFDHIPYLNSSLFEIHQDENNGIKVSNLVDGLTIDYYAKTVVKDANNQRKKGKASTLPYLLEFLDAFDFANDSNEEVVSQSKDLISASVLGLIFEKINGYKDGSFYTPSFITMYMARETITKTVIDQFNVAKGWQCKTLTDLHNKDLDIKETNTLINSIKICDPAVGSGHFLVSALNEMLRIKSELGVLVSEDGKRIKDYSLSIENDDLIIKSAEGELFEYKKGNTEKTRIQKTLFKEKQSIIENCLFGVDINPNSVNICRLRLWIELLKNAYYKADGQLDTLPNIDINIKCGNSLISRFGLTDDLDSKTIKAEIQDYKQKVAQYKENIGSKRDVLQAIDAIKQKFQTSLKANHNATKKLNGALSQYVAKFSFDGLNSQLKLKAIDELKLLGKQTSFLDENIDQTAKTKFKKEVDSAWSSVEQIESGAIYQNAFEWRFEFPEVLNEAGEFVGFDVVIGNPPYISLSKLKETDYSTFNYKVFDKSGDILALFIEKGLGIATENARLSYVVSNSWLKTKYGETLKQLIKSSGNTTIINFEDTQLFEEATVESCITSIAKSSELALYISTIKNFDTANATPDSIKIGTSDTTGDNDDALMQRIEQAGKPLKDWDVSINFGIKTGFNEAFIIDTAKRNELVKTDPNCIDVIKPILRGRDIQKYSYTWADFWLINTHNNPPVNVDTYQAIKAHLELYKPQLERRLDKGKTPYNLRNCAYLKDFDKPKIIWGEISDKPKFMFVDDAYFAEATTFFMTGENLKFLLSILNSNLSKWYFERISTTTGMGTNRWKKFKLELLPIKNSDNPQPFVDKVNTIIAAKQNNTDTSKLEAEVDAMVYALYGLTGDEIKLIEGVT